MGSKPEMRAEASAWSAAEQVAAAFARMSGLFLSAETVSTALQVITALAVEMVPYPAVAGITLLDAEGARISAAATDVVAEQADRLQYELGSGPCLSAWADRVVVAIDDLAADERWPQWSAEVARRGLCSSLSVPMVAGEQCLGAIKIYTRQPATWGPREERLLTMFAAQAAMLLANTLAARDAERVSAIVAQSLQSRELLAVAKGIVMARDGVDEHTAFLSMADTARRQRTTVARVAEKLTRSTVRPPR
ncbi:GAF and ANTAR domain-containing protein [Nocardia sp. NPDC051321]|uniref:GAF and ANTAR domain-containing protein n=1 Tax=Nocardia sp. NPDC051321 TaxID=3364323 RepID=UPI003794B12F